MIAWGNCRCRAFFNFGLRPSESAPSSSCRTEATLGRLRAGPRRGGLDSRKNVAYCFLVDRSMQQASSPRWSVYITTTELPCRSCFCPLFSGVSCSRRAFRLAFGHDDAAGKRTGNLSSWLSAGADTTLGKFLLRGPIGGTFAIDFDTKRGIEYFAIVLSGSLELAHIERCAADGRVPCRARLFNRLGGRRPIQTPPCTPFARP